VRRRFLALAAACSVASCSYAFVPKVTRETKPDECSSGEGAVVIDTLAAVVAGAGTLLGGALVVAGAGDWDNEHAPLAQIGATIGIPSALVLLAYGSSARHGAHHGRACRRLRQPDVIVDDERSCRSALEAILAGELFDGPVLPVDCPIEAARATFPGLAPRDEHGALGEQRALTYRAAGHVRVWHSGGIIVAVELTNPWVSRTWIELRAGLGPADAELAAGHWVFARRGRAAIVDADGAVRRVLVFPPTTLDWYRSALAF
jgi:hypothetical protein